MERLISRMPAPFQLKLTADFFDASGRTKYDDIGLSVLAAAPHIQHAAFAAHSPEITPEQLAGANGVIVLTPKVSAQSVSITPASAASILMRKPFSCQKSLSSGQSFSGVASWTKSQRCEPERSIFMRSTSGSTTGALERVAAFAGSRRSAW